MILTDTMLRPNILEVISNYKMVSYESSKITYIIGSNVDLIMSNMNLLQGFGTLFFSLQTTRKKNAVIDQRYLMLLRIARDRLIYFDER